MFTFVGSHPMDWRAVGIMGSSGWWLYGVTITIHYLMLLIGHLLQVVDLNLVGLWSFMPNACVRPRGEYKLTGA